jgi:ribosomal protein S18 acetylase RimI-like enzyme
MSADTPNLTIRPFAMHDRSALEALWADVFANDPPRNKPAALIDRKLAVDPELLLVAILDGKLVGAVMAGFDGFRGWIYHLAVTTEYRRRGIGTQLVRVAEAGLLARGCPKVNLQVRATNQGVVGFYQSLGYEVEERISMGRPLLR